MMVYLSRVRRLQFWKSAARGIGAFVTLTVIGCLASAVIALAAGRPLSVGFDYGGPLLADAAASGALAACASFSGFRRKLAVIAGRGGPVLYFLAALGGCSLIFAAITTDSTFWSRSTGWHTVPVLAIGSAGLGFMASGALALLVSFPAGAFLAVTACIRMSAGFLRAALKKPAPADLSASADAPWPIRVAAALMPPQAGCRWRDDFNEARYDYDEDRHIRLLHDFLLHAPAVIFWAWGAFLGDIVSVSTSRGHR